VCVQCAPQLLGTTMLTTTTTTNGMMMANDTVSPPCSSPNGYLYSMGSPSSRLLPS
jgi:carbohydrate-binding DOMON domain-containing protein